MGKSKASGLTERDRICIPVPLYHCFGMVLGCLACTSHGACMVLPAECFAAPAVLQAIQTERCTVLHGVPTMFRALLKTPPLRISIVRRCALALCPAHPCPIELMQEVTDRLTCQKRSSPTA